MIRQLFFRRSNGEYIELHSGCLEQDALSLIDRFCKSQNYLIPYVRWWDTPNGRMYDVGSHTESFLWGVLPSEDSVAGPRGQEDTASGATEEERTEA